MHESDVIETMGETLLLDVTYFGMQGVFGGENGNWFWRQDFEFENKSLPIVRVFYFLNHKIWYFKVS